VLKTEERVFLMATLQTMNTALTTYEMRLVKDAKLLLTKNEIIQKVYHFFGVLSEEYKTLTAAKQLDTVVSTNAKIAKGENYKGLPYVIMDYPRAFGKEDVFAIRTFFWWGNFFSITLQLSGRYRQRYEAAIEKGIKEDAFDGWFIVTSEDRWQHDFDEDYVPLRTAGEEILHLSHIKIAKKIPLDKWDETHSFFKKNFTLLIETLCG